jgi:hypothetical protein
MHTSIKPGGPSALVMTSLAMILVPALMTQPAGASTPQVAPKASAAPSAWQVQKTQNPLVKDEVFYGTSCTSTSSCVAVGYRLGNKGAEVTLAEVWNGTSWSMTKTPNPAGSVESQLSSVSCVSATDCVAVGQVEGQIGQQPLAESWNGTSWTAEDISTGGIFAALDGVSCTTADQCMAVGSIDSFKGGQKALAEYWNGTTWTKTKVAQLSGTESPSLESVSCSSSGACEAVGTYENTSEDLSTFAEAWTGTRWISQTTPNPKGSSASELVSVSCGSAVSCLAVGYTESATSTASLSELWNGSAWSIARTPSPSGSQGSELLGVSCTSPTACTAVGGYFSSSDLDATLALAWNGESWSIEASQNPSTEGSVFLAVACTSESDCTAVGVAFGTRSPALPLVEYWDGTTWSTQHAFTKRAAVGAALYNVSCTSASFCLAVGSDALEDPIAEIWNGADWKLISVPVGSGGGELDDVSCFTATDCIAVGSGLFGEVPLAEQWNGKTWTALETPVGVEGDLDSVSCASADSCIAVGSTEGPTAITPLAESWNGTEWTVMNTPSGPAGSIQNDLYSTSCGSAGSCVAVGVSVNDEDIATPFIESWDGGNKWKVLESASTSLTDLGLTGVSCTSPTGCIATGYSIDRLDGSSAYSEIWNGRSWSSEKIPTPTGGAQIFDVECSSATACVTVGARGKGAVAEGWNGTAWTIQKTSAPSGSGVTPVFDGVDCSSSTTCTAVGDYSTSSGLVQTLAEAS